MSEIKLKEIISKYINIEINNINNETKIGPSELKGSIIMYRMFSELEENGFIFTPGESPSNYYELKVSLSMSDDSVVKSDRSKKNELQQSPNLGCRIGIDIQQINDLPLVADDLDIFYINNFTEKEISHSLNKGNPIESFAGIFALKEAIIKTSFTNNQPNLKSIEIGYNGNIPMFDNYQVSISHSGDMAVAVAIENPNSSVLSQNDNLNTKIIYKSAKNISIWKKLSSVICLIFIMMLIAFFIHILIL
jgi:phosphopantetheine--protein transferase-like protein